VTDAFAAKYADATEVEWTQECPMTWEAEFILGNAEKSALFAKDGKWLETEFYVCHKELSAEVYKSLTIVFDGFRIEEMEGIEKADFTEYAIDLRKFNTSVEILAAADGTFTLESIIVEDMHGKPCCAAVMEKCCKAGPPEGMGCHSKAGVETEEEPVEEE
jgi:hypothetical protein